MPKYRVLIVDDQREIRFVLRTGLQALFGTDVQVTDVPSGEEAILVISRQPIDLLVTDIRLPGISGLELRERAMIRNPGLKIILMTGMPEPRTRRDVEKAGAEAYFFKPFELNDFLEAAKKCLGLQEQSVIPEEAAGDRPMPSLAERLSKLHQDVGALGVILLNEAGQVVAETGQLAEYEEESPFLSALYTLFGAALKVGHLMGATVRDWMFFDGQNYDLVLTHIGSAFSLLVVLPNATLEDQYMTNLLASLRAAIIDLSVILDQMGVAVETPQAAAEVVAGPETQPEEIDISEVLPELDAIFKKAPKAAKIKDIDAFWEQASNSSTEDVRRADAISYDQARQLGLAPEE